MGAPAIFTGWKTLHPPSFAKDRQGLLMLCNGLNRPLVWDGLSQTAYQAGIVAPAGAPVMTATGSGGSLSTGTYYCGYRYADIYERVSELSVLDDVAVTSGQKLNWAITASSETNRVRWVDLFRSTFGQSTTVYKIVRLANHGTVSSTSNNGSGFCLFSVPSGHGLQTGAVILMSGHSVAAYNTGHNVTRISDTLFSTDVAYTSAGTTQGSYVLAGYNGDSASDATIAATTNYALAILNTDGSLNARRQGLPPPECAVCVWFQDRMYYAVQKRYSVGTVSTTASGITISGSSTPSTAWIEEFGAQGNWYETSNWWMQISGEPKPFKLATYNNALSMFTTLPFAPTLTQNNVSYVMYPDPERFRNTLIYSEIDEAESVPYDPGIDPDTGKVIGYVNTVTVQENTGDDDDITALMPYGFALYVLKERHIYRLQNISNDPSVYLVAARGCLNQRCWAYHEGLAYLMDKTGIYSFDGGAVEPLSMPIQNLWRDGTLDFSQADWFHAAVEPTSEVVKFFVKYTSDGGTRPRRALVYHIRSQSWTMEEYPWEIGAATKADIGDTERLLVGSANENIYKVNDGYTDDGTAIRFAWRGGLHTLTVDAQQQSQALQVAFQPTEGQEVLSARIYYDNRSEPTTWLADENTGTNVRIVQGSQDITIAIGKQPSHLSHLDTQEQPGFARQEFGGRGDNQSRHHRWVSVELQGVAPTTEQVTVYGVAIEGVDRG